MSAGMSAAENSLWFVDSCTQSGQAHESRRRMGENSITSPSIGMDIFDDSRPSADTRLESDTVVLALRAAVDKDL